MDDIKDRYASKDELRYHQNYSQGRFEQVKGEIQGVLKMVG